MRTVWVVVANSSIARVYSVDEAQDELSLIKELSHSESKLKDQDLVADRPGRFSERNTMRGAMVPESDPKELEMEKFSRELAQEVGKAAENKQFTALVIAASPKFYGLLQQHLSEMVQKKIYKVFQKDYTQVSPQELENIFHSTYRYILADRVSS